jgi:hypothetical protein
MENKLIVEIKSEEHLEKIHHKTVLNYLKLTGIKLAILVNFNVEFIKQGVHRKIRGELLLGSYEAHNVTQRKKALCSSRLCGKQTNMYEIIKKAYLCNCCTA